MPAKVKLINLLPPSEFEKSFWGRFLKWAVTAGRKIIILTELVIILAFLSRFKLDEDMRNLNEEINAKSKILESSITFEENFNKLNAKISATKQLEKMQSHAAELLGQISKHVPPDVSLNDMLITKSNVNMTGIALNEKPLKQMLTTMDKETAWKSIELQSIDSEDGGGVRFVLNVYP